MKKRAKNAKNKYVKPGALAQLRESKVIGKKRVLIHADGHAGELPSLNRTPQMSPLRLTIPDDDAAVPHKKLPNTPRTPLLPVDIVDRQSHSRLETLPIDLLVKIMCHLHHDQLRAVFHVSQRVRMAVIIAKQLYFNYTTPDRSRQEQLRNTTPLPSDHWPFTRNGGGGMVQMSLVTPWAPRHVHRGPRPRLDLMDMRQIAAVLFQESSASSSLPQRKGTPPGLIQKPVCKLAASSRFLLYEDELCQAVAQNKLL